MMQQPTQTDIDVAVLATEVKHLTEAVNSLKDAVDELKKDRVAVVPAVPVTPASMKDRLLDNPGFFVFLSSIVWVGGKEVIVPLVKLLPGAH